MTRLLDQKLLLLSRVLTRHFFFVSHKQFTTKYFMNTYFGFEVNIFHHQLVPCRTKGILAFDLLGNILLDSYINIKGTREKSLYNLHQGEPIISWTMEGCRNLEYIWTKDTLKIYHRKTLVGFDLDITIEMAIRSHTFGCSGLQICEGSDDYSSDKWWNFHLQNQVLKTANVYTIRNEISPMQGKIISILGEIGLATPSFISYLGLMDNKVVTSQLSDLKKNDYVASTPLKRNSCYRIIKTDAANYFSFINYAEKIKRNQDSLWKFH
jgi:hypothetical protein